jgi:hypothetical protein
MAKVIDLYPREDGVFDEDRENVPELWEMEPMGTVAIWAQDRQVLVDLLAGIPEQAWGDMVMPCGTEIVSALNGEAPESDLPCPCGDPTHWLVKYGELS